MAKFRSKTVVVEAITFEEFVQYGKDSGGNIVNGMPWSFKYKGYGVTHENDQAYLIATPCGVVKFTPDDMLVTDDNVKTYPLNIGIFNNNYEVA